MRLRVRGRVRGLTIGCRVREATGWPGVEGSARLLDEAKPVWDASEAKAQGEAGWGSGLGLGLGLGLRLGLQTT